MVPVSDYLPATVTISRIDFRSPWRQVIDGEAIVTDENGLAMFELVRRQRNGGAAAALARLRCEPLTCCGSQVSQGHPFAVLVILVGLHRQQAEAPVSLRSCRESTPHGVI